MRLYLGSVNTIGPWHAGSRLDNRYTMVIYRVKWQTHLTAHHPSKNYTQNHIGYEFGVKKFQKNKTEATRISLKNNCKIGKCEADHPTRT